MSISIESQYEFLVKHVPLSSSVLFDQCSYDLDQNRRETIMCHRIIALSAILNNTKRENRIKYRLSNAITSPRAYVLNPEFLDAALTISPLFCQQVTQLFNSIHSDTSYLADMILKIKGTKEFDFAACSAIPSLFGYYSSNEHINLAMGFFVKVITTTDSKTGTPLIAPFFSTPSLFRFFESALSPFLDNFIRKASSKFDVKTVENYAKDLTRMFVSSVSLIPHPHVVLLRMMKVKWGENEAVNFFCENLLKKQTILWFDSIKDDQFSRENLQKILLKLNSIEIFRALCKSESTIEVPFQYTVFGDPFLHFLTSISDVRCLYHLFLTKLNLGSMKILDTENVDFNAVFWIKTYPPHQLETTLSNVPLIFPKIDIKVPENEDFERQWRCVLNLSDQKECDPMKIVKSFSKSKDFDEYALLMAVDEMSSMAGKFEMFLMNMVNLKTSKEWRRISSAHEFTILSPVVKKIALKNERKCKTFLKTFENASINLYSEDAMRYQYLFIVQRFLNKLFKGYENEFAFIKKVTTKLFENKLSNLESLKSNLNGSQSAIFWETVELLRTTDCIDLPYQFMAIMRSIIHLKEISDSDDEKIKEYLELAISLSCSKNIFYLYMVINLFAMSNETFRKFCTEEEEHLWVLFQQKMLEIVMSEPTVSERYFLLLQDFSQFNND